MAIKKFKPTSPARRYYEDADFSDLAKKGPEKSLTEALKVSADHLEKLGVVDEVIPEPTGGAHNDPAQAASALRYILQKHLNDLRALKEEFNRVIEVATELGYRVVRVNTNDKNLSQVADEIESILTSRLSPA